MEYAGQDRPGADAIGAFPASGLLDADDVRYADSGFLPDEAMPTDEARTPRHRHPTNGDRIANGHRVAGGGGPVPTGLPPEISHCMEVSHHADRGGLLMDTSQLTGASDPADGGGWYADGGGWYADGEAGANPAGANPAGANLAGDRYAGYERYAGERAGQPWTPDEDRFLTRVYATPADPREVPPDDDQGGRRAAGPPAGSSLVSRLARLRLDRWLIAVGSLAAAVAVIAAFVTAGGSAAAPGPSMTQTGTTHAAQPACVSPAPGH